MKGCFRCGLRDHYADKCGLEVKVLTLLSTSRSGVTTNGNLRGKKKDQNGQPVDQGLYCGRAIHMGGWHLAESIWCNKFKMNNEEFREYILHTPELLAALPSLKGNKLWCWCKDETHMKYVPCHTDVLIELCEHCN